MSHPQTERRADKQGTSPQSKFLDACRAFNRGESNETLLIDTTARLGFVNVIDAFHVVGGEEVPIRFSREERRSSTPGLRLEDHFLELKAGAQGCEPADDLRHGLSSRAVTDAAVKTSRNPNAKDPTTQARSHGTASVGGQHCQRLEPGRFRGHGALDEEPDRDDGGVTNAIAGREAAGR